MKTKIIHVKEEYNEALKYVGDTLRSGGVVAFPTETVYGLGANALDEEAAKKIYEAKGRPSDNPLIVHIADMEGVEKIAKHISQEASQMMEEFWPGPLTLVLHKQDVVPDGTTGGLDTVAVRMPNHELARDIIQAGGGYIAAPSANVSGRPSPTLGSHVVEDMDGRIAAIVVKDNVKIGLESTIVDCTVEPPMILRPGAITKRMIEERVCPVQVDKTLMAADSKEAPRAPGMKYRHYAPKGEMLIVDGSQEERKNYISTCVQQRLLNGDKVAVITREETLQEYKQLETAKLGTQQLHIQSLGCGMEVEHVGAEMYKILRDMDTLGVDYIYCEEVPEDEVWAAVRNRLHKAAGHNIVRV